MNYSDSPPSETQPALASFRIVVQMDSRHITPVRRVVAEIAKSIGLADDMASRLALAAHELMENALKYSVDPDRSVRLRLSIEAGQKAQVTVSNASNRACYEQTQQRVRQINRTDNPAELYQAMIAKSLKRKRGSGLGLARIRAEADMQLHCVLRGDMLSVRATLATGAQP